MAIESFSKEVWDSVKLLILGMVALFGWNIKRQVSRGDQMEKDIQELAERKVEETVFNDTLKALRGDIKEYHRETRQEIKDIHNRLNELKK